MEVRKKDGTRIICVLLIIASSILYYITYSFPKEKGPVASAYGSAFFPRILLIFIMAVSVILFLQATLRKLKPAVEEMIRLNRTQVTRCFAIWAIGLLFYWAWQYVGYLYSSPFYMLAVGLLLNVRKWRTLVLLAAVAPLMYVVFEYFLQVGL